MRFRRLRVEQGRRAREEKRSKRNAGERRKKKRRMKKKIPERKRGVSGSRSCLSINKAWFLK